MAKDLNNASLLPLGHKERTARRHIKEVIDDDVYDKSQRVWAKHVWDEANYRFKWVELSDEELKILVNIDPRITGGSLEDL